jgi:hypothetical protein
MGQNLGLNEEDMDFLKSLPGPPRASDQPVKKPGDRQNQRITRMKKMTATQIS